MSHPILAPSVNQRTPQTPTDGPEGAEIRIRPGVVFRVKITPQTATDSDSVLLEHLLEFDPSGTP
jgi:hypothetical protein